LKNFFLKILIKIYGVLPKKLRGLLKLGSNASILKVLPEYAYGYIKPNNVRAKLFLNDYIQKRIYATGYFEKDESLALLKLFPNNGIFLDIGANIGVYSFIFYKKAEHVYAFEATKKTYDHLCEIIKDNKILNITPVFAAVHSKDDDEITIFSDYHDNCGNNSMYGSIENIANTVMSISIDTWVKNNNIKDISMIKIDIEGNELSAFKGMKKSLKKFKPIIFCEINYHASISAGSTSLELFNYIIEKFNYCAKIFINKQYVEIDREYIEKNNKIINCYFFPNEKEEN